ncbi:hypothetical protein D3C76_1634350 [compost metagenome]
MCEFIKKLSNIMTPVSKIELVLTEDELNWYFNIKSDKIKDIDKAEIYLLKSIVLNIKNVELKLDDSMAQLIIKKLN